MEEGSYNNIVAKYHSKGTARWPIWATHHSQGTAWWPIWARNHSQGTAAASAASASHPPGAGATPPAGGVAPAGGEQRSISPQVLTKAWRLPLQCASGHFIALVIQIPAVSAMLRAASSSLPYGHLPISCIWLKISQEAPLQVLTLHILKQFYIRGILQSGCLDKYNFEIMCNVSQVILLYRLKSIWFSSDDGLVMETPSQNGENGEPPGDPIHDSRAHNFFVVKCHLKKRKIIPVKCICFSITCYWI